MSATEVTSRELVSISLKSCNYLIKKVWESCAVRYGSMCMSVCVCETEGGANKECEGIMMLYNKQRFALITNAMSISSISCCCP